MRPTLTVANASAFWGDQPGAAARLVAARPDLDFLTFDHLAELSLSILAIQRARDPESGYARDFVDAVRSLVPFYQAGGRTRLVTNAGGLAPDRCARACAAVLRAAGLDRLKIAVVRGDDVLAAVAQDPAAFPHLETAAPLPPLAGRLVTANAYLGAAAIADALRAGANLVITGRTADPSLTVGPCLAHFGWAADDWDHLAGATVTGHLLECGTQVCGGFSTDWLELPRPEDIGFPIAEISADGSCVITKPAGTGGAVNGSTVKEQLLYEIGDPGCYLSPDVTASFLTLRIEDLGADRVRVSGATGRPPPSALKVSATYRDGCKAHGQLVVFGHQAVRKARRAGEGLLTRLRAAGCNFRETLVECLGTGASAGGIARRGDEDDLLETVLRISVAADDAEPVERFVREIAPLVTCGPQGVAGYAGGRPKVLPIFGYWPCRIDRAHVRPDWSFVP
jgi:hypothetical protein